MTIIISLPVATLQLPSFPKCTIWCTFLVRSLGRYALILHYLFILLFIGRTGPLISTWCMRMEGKNLLLKRAAQTSNFKNVPYTVAKRHQCLLCAYLQGQNFFDTTLECGPGIYIFMRVFVARCMD